MFRVQGAGFRVQGAVSRVEGSGLRVEGSGFRADLRGRSLAFFVVGLPDAGQLGHGPLELPAPPRQIRLG